MELRSYPWPASGPHDDEACILETGADSLEMLAVYLGVLGVNFSVTGPPDLVAHLRVLADRYGRSFEDVTGPVG